MGKEGTPVGQSTKNSFSFKIFSVLDIRGKLNEFFQHDEQESSTRIKE